MEQTYEIEVRARCKVAAKDDQQADAAAQRFAELLGGWIDGSVGNSPLDHHLAIASATAGGVLSPGTTRP
jgi:hypothetical protein